ncbi:hypothetical protein OG758_12315 [Streptomyces sp. NBC_01474]|uniref:hypothetical protein n=1 Tax=Streptomyces sp. NBC_01474 TaxID=2903880 RepID=UPI002DDABC1E|nr:hypothetical protein [Streptomyces sp. NBC_01474]WSD94845.1 hypothetical protein OG758_12315 [Streptomyces sp. NBC_01474]
MADRLICCPPAISPYLLLHRQQELFAPVEVRAALSALPGTLAGVSRPFLDGSPLQVPRREGSWALARAAGSFRPLTVYGDEMADR